MCVFDVVNLYVIFIYSSGNYIGSYKVPSPTGSLKPVTTVQEPSVDFELDIKVDIDSGQCVLHPKDKDLKDEAESKRYMLFQND